MNATTNSDGALTFSVMTGPCASVSETLTTGTFRSTGAGVCVVKASTVATINFSAGSATQSVIITQATPTIAFGPAPMPTYPPAGNFTVSATTNSNGALTFSYASGPCGLLSATATAATFRSTGTGMCVVVARTAATVNFTAGAATQSVTIAAPSSPVCNSNGFYTGTFNGNLTISAGQMCNLGGPSGGVKGNVTVQSGGTLLVGGGAVISGNVTVQSRGDVTVYGTVEGNVTVQSGGDVAVYGTVNGNVNVSGGVSISGATINGNLNISSLAETHEVAGGVCQTVVKGDLVSQYNESIVVIGDGPQFTPYFPCGGNQIVGNVLIQNNLVETIFAENQVSGNLTCSGNASIVSGDNAVSGRKQGQCAGF